VPKYQSAKTRWIEILAYNAVIPNVCLHVPTIR